jgi:hypothetical protein
VNLCSRFRDRELIFSIEVNSDTYCTIQHGCDALHADEFSASIPANKALDKKSSSRESLGMTCSIEVNFTATEVHA